MSSWTNYFSKDDALSDVAEAAEAWMDEPKPGVLSIYLPNDMQLSDVLVSSEIGPADMLDPALSAISPDETYKYAKWSFQASIVNELSKDDPRYGWHNPQGDDAVPDTLALDANMWFSTIQPAEDGAGFDPTHLKDVGIIIYKLYLDTSAGNKVSYEPVEAYCGSLCKDDKDPNTGVTKFLDTIVNS